MEPDGDKIRRLIEMDGLSGAQRQFTKEPLWHPILQDLMRHPDDERDPGPIVPMPLGTPGQMAFPGSAKRFT
jgi:hypothetical protein